MKMLKQRLISATEFKKHFLQLIDEVTGNKNSFTITKRKVPVARVVPLQEETASSKTYFGCMHGTIKIKEEIINSSFESEWALNHE